MSRKEEKKKRKGLKIFGIIVLVLLIILAILVGSIFWFVSSKLNKMQTVDIDEADLAVSTEVEQNLEEYRNIAIFGIDSREDTYSKEIEVIVL